MLTIDTGRLLLRPFTREDYDDLYEFLSQRRDDPFEAYPGITRKNGTEHLAYRLNSPEFYAMELKETGSVIGNIYWGNRDFSAREVGFIVNKNFQRRGFAREAVLALLEQAFKEGVHRVYAECDPRNKYSWRLLEACGFRREATLRQNVWFHRDKNGDPIWQDNCVYAMLAEDF